MPKGDIHYVPQLPPSQKLDVNILDYPVIMKSC